MPKRSAGLLLHRLVGGATQVLLVHPGGPFWARRDAGAWSIPKGEYGDAEDAEAAARREFTEELGLPPPPGEAVPLGEVRQAGGKVVTAFALAGDLDASSIRSNEITISWPPRSGRTLVVPEIDRAEWFDLPHAREKLLSGQVPFLDRLEDLLEP